MLSFTRLVNTLRKSYCRPQYEILGTTMKKNLTMEEKKYYLHMATQFSSNAVVLEKDILLDYPSIIKQKKKWSHHQNWLVRKGKNCQEKAEVAAEIMWQNPGLRNVNFDSIARWHKHQKCYHFLVKYSGVVVTDELRIGKWNGGLAVGCRSCAMRYPWQLCKS